MVRVASERGSPGEHRAAPRRQRREAATDSPVEQGLEVGTSLGRCDGKGARLAVTRGRLPREGKALEGGAPVGTPPQPGRHAGRGGRNPVNPMVGDGMQQAHRPSRRRNPSRWQPNHEDGTSTRRGNLAPRPRPRPWSRVDSPGHVDGGAIFEEPCGRQLDSLESGACEKRLRMWSTHGSGGWRFGTTRPRGTAHGHQTATQR
jgi:hypothetical protein